MLFACRGRSQEQDRDPFGPQGRNHLAQERGLAGAGDTETSITISPEVHRKRAAPLWLALRFTIGSWISRSPGISAGHLSQASLTVASIWRSSWRTRSVVTWPPSPSSRMKAELRA